MKNRLLIVITSLGFGGLPRIARNVANHYAEKGWDVGFAFLMSGGEDVRYGLDDKIEIFSYEGFDVRDVKSDWKKRFAAFRWIKFIRKTINEYKPTNILVMTLKMGAMTSLAANMKDRPRIVMREINDPKAKDRSQLMNHLLFRCCGRIDGIIFQTEWERSCYPKKLQKKGRVIPNPVVLKERATYPKRKVFVAMSDLAKRKCIDVMIEAFRIFNKKHPEFTLEIYGKGVEEASLKSLVKEMHMEEQIIFKGPRNDVHTLIRDAVGFITTSEHEGLSNSLLEAFLMGIPCISSDWPGVEDVITNEENGLIVKRGDVEGFAKAFERLVEDDELCRKFSENAVKEWERYDTEKVFGQYCDLIEGIE